MGSMADVNNLVTGRPPKPALPVPGVLASAATGVVSWIERHNGDVDRIFGHAGIAPEMTGSPTLLLSLKSFCRLFEESARQTRNDNFGLWFGVNFEPRDLGLWGYAALSAPTLQIALETLVDLFPLHQQCSFMRLVRQGSSDMVRLEYRIESTEICERRQDAELTMGQLLSVVREALGPTGRPTKYCWSTRGQKVGASISGPSQPRSSSRSTLMPWSSIPRCCRRPCRGGIRV